MRCPTASAQHRFKPATLVPAQTSERHAAGRGETGIRTYLTGSKTWAPAPGWPLVRKPKVKVWQGVHATRPRPGGSR